MTLECSEVNTSCGIGPQGMLALTMAKHLTFPILSSPGTFVPYRFALFTLLPHPLLP